MMGVRQRIHPAAMPFLWTFWAGARWRRSALGRKLEWFQFQDRDQLYVFKDDQVGHG
jgi:hypothetical protein